MQAPAPATAPPAPQPPETLEDEPPAGSYNGIAVPDGYVPEALRRFGRGGAER
jgi:hypothetical protein